MTPKEKAIWLFDDFNKFNITHYEKKECVLKCVYELKKLADSVWEKLDDYHTVEYWEEVEQEINKL